METAEQIAERLQKDGFLVIVNRDSDNVKLWLGQDEEPIEHTLEEFEDIWSDVNPESIDTFGF